MLSIFGVGYFTRFSLVYKYSGNSTSMIGLPKSKKSMLLPSVSNYFHSRLIVNESFNLFTLLNDHILGYYLKRYIRRRLFVLRKSRCWRGFRHEQHLPVRGQRSKTNANTKKKRLA